MTKNPPIKKISKTPRKITAKVKIARPSVFADNPIIVKSEKVGAVESFVIPATTEKKSFTIEKVAWKWHPNVKNPNVYRDYEFIRTKTKEDALSAIDFLLNEPVGLTYTITVFRDGEYFTYYQHSMPCYGGLVKYKDSHGEKFWMNPYFPRDIRVAFPEGEIIFIGICRQNVLKDIVSPYNDFLLSKESPWIGAFGSKETIIFQNNYFILTNMDGDPTVFYSFLRLSGFMGGYSGGSSKKDCNPKAEILLVKCGTPYADPRRLAGQKPITFKHSWRKDSQGYVRPYNESIFKTNLPTKLKDFGSLPTTNYPPSFTFTNEYFKNTMKEKFGVDIANPNDTKLHDALVDSWEFFKKESEKLGDE